MSVRVKNARVRSARTKRVTIAITGANGYVGSSLSSYLSARGYSVIRFVRTAPSMVSSEQTQRGRVQKIQVPQTPTQQIWTRQIRVTSSQAWRTYELGKPFDPSILDGVQVLVHCAHDVLAHGKDAWRINVEGTLALFRACKHRRIRVVFVSSMAAFDDCRSQYGKMKQAIERSGLADVIVRPGLVYGQGPNGELGGMLATLQRVVRKTSLVPFITKLDKQIYMCHIDDLCAAIARLLVTRNARIPTTPIVVASQKTVAFKDVLRSLTQKRLFFVLVPYTLALAGLRALEFFGRRAKLRADGLVGLAYTDTNPDFSAARRLGIRARNFTLS